MRTHHDLEFLLACRQTEEYWEPKFPISDNNKELHENYVKAMNRLYDDFASDDANPQVNFNDHEVSGKLNELRKNGWKDEEQDNKLLSPVEIWYKGFKIVLMDQQDQMMKNFKNVKFKYNNKIVYPWRHWAKSKDGLDAYYEWELNKIEQDTKGLATSENYGDYTNDDEDAVAMFGDYNSYRGMCISFIMFYFYLFT